MIIKEDAFWTTAGCYWRLPYIAPDLFTELKESELVLFKGDLNYRKLTGDVCSTYLSLDSARTTKANDFAR